MAQSRSPRSSGDILKQLRGELASTLQMFNFQSGVRKGGNSASDESFSSSPLVSTEKLGDFSINPPKRSVEILPLVNEVQDNLNTNVRNLWQTVTADLEQFDFNKMIKPHSYIKSCNTIQKQLKALNSYLFKSRKDYIGNLGTAKFKMVLGKKGKEQKDAEDAHIIMIDGLLTEIELLSAFIEHIKKLLEDVNEHLPHSYFNFFFFMIFLALSALSFFYLSPLLAPFLMTMIHSSLLLLLAEIGVAMVSSGIVVLAVIAIATIIQATKNCFGNDDEKQRASSKNASKLNYILAFSIAFIPGSVVGSYIGTNLLAHLGFTLSAQYTPAVAFGFGFVTGGLAFVVALFISALQTYCCPKQAAKSSVSSPNGFWYATSNGLTGAFYSGMAIHLIEQALVVMGVSMAACPIPLGVIAILGSIIGFLIGAAIAFKENPQMYPALKASFFRQGRGLSTDEEPPSSPRSFPTLSSSSSSC